MTGKTINIKQFRKAVKGSAGLYTAIGQKLGFCRQSVATFVNSCPEAQKLIQDERESITDLAEGKLFQTINNGEAWGIKFYLSTVGKDRGYVEKQEIVHSGIEPLQIVINQADDKKDKLRIEQDSTNSLPVPIMGSRKIP